MGRGLCRFLSIMCAASSIRTHVKCRGKYYPKTNDLIMRQIIPDDKLNWNTDWEEYNPTEFTAPSAMNKPWSDPDIGSPGFEPRWNSLDGKIDRASHTATYSINEDGRPRNPIGRTGVSGRGVLGRWGPNHAADPIVTRWKGQTNGDTGKPILQFVAIQRHDCGEWAIPGGMVDPSEKVTVTLKREFLEEAMDTLSATDERKAELQQIIGDFFNKGAEVYRGYVDDPRNTDNSWMETVAYNFHDDSGAAVGQFPLTAGDDAKNVTWTDISSCLKLYASHAEFIKMVAQRHGAHW